MQEENTVVFDIEKFAVHDGPGIRTVVFMKGCPLHCLWCHNPESQSFQPEIFFMPEKCTACGRCAVPCPRHCHVFRDGVHSFERTHCIKCGKCADACLTGALENTGRIMSVSEVMRQVLADRLFYENSGGGVTLSGGEPLAHFAFSLALLKRAKSEGIHTAVETCGYASKEKVSALLPYVDLWLWDVKAAPDSHLRLTGVSAGPVLENLYCIDAAGTAIVLRCPLVPGINDRDEDLLHIAELAESLHHVRRIDLEPYHPLGESKSRHLGRSEVFHADFVPAEKIKEYARIIGTHTSVKIHHP